MSQVAHFGLDEALTSKDPVERLTARCAASKWTQEFADWLQSEADRGEALADIMLAMTHVMISTHSGAVANFMRPKGFTATADMFKAAIDADYVDHANRCRSELIRLGRAPA